MDLSKKPAINETWMLCSLGGFLGLFLLLLLLTNNPQTIDITDVRTTVFAFITSQQQQQQQQQQVRTMKVNSYSTQLGVESLSIINATTAACRMYEGKWVYKPQENPTYHVMQCPFLEDKMSCQRNRRPDSDYEGWSWESNDCQIPLFDGKDMVVRLRGKRVIIVGDSLNRNMWESLACLVYTSLPSPAHAFVDAQGYFYKVIRAKDYNFTLEFHWAPFLVHLDEKHKSGKKVLSLDSLQPSSEQWRGADVMLFNSGHWWTHNGKLKSWDVFEYKGEHIEEMETEVAYERALTTWSNWLSRNVDPTKTKVYFRSISTEHKTEKWCFNASRPIEDESYVQKYPRSMMDVVESKISEMNGGVGVHVSYLNITKLSSYRIDAHPSVYRFKEGYDANVTDESVLRVKADCSHWCLPGLPDTWNRIFYASLFFDHLSPGQASTASKDRR